MLLFQEPQGEAIAFDHRGTGCFTISEGVSQQIYLLLCDELTETMLWQPGSTTWDYWHSGA